jgi:tellurite resistance protein
VDVNYDSISHLVRSVRVEPDYVDIEFCSDCGELEQTVTVARGSAQEPVSQTPPKPVLSTWFRSRLRRFLGRVEDLESLSHKEKAVLTCRAFNEIKPRLRLVSGRWVRANKDEHPSEFFDRQLRANPIVERYDIEVLVRVLLEVSRSDSELRTEERAFLEEIVSDEATIERLSQAPHITVAELAETSSVQVKETTLMLAWAMAYADGKLDYEEISRLSQLCRGFMLPEKRVRELQMASKLFLLDRHFQNLKGDVSGRQLRADFEKKAQEWGLDDQQLQTLRSWYPEDLG